MSAQDDVVPGSRPPSGTEPGASSTPAADGQGTVDLDDRTATGSPAANQSKSEPMPPAGGDRARDLAPDTESMTVGADDPQAPSHPMAGPAGDPGSSGLPPLGSALPTSQDEARGAAGGSAFRQPGSNGAEGDDEQMGTDLPTSARRTDPTRAPGPARGAGDAQGVPVVSEESSPGTSEASAVVQGSRTPQ